MASLYVNHLIHEKSPYLQQHAYNPVEWYAWGEKAIEKAQKENKPILLSIGYAACHWCHVMAHESFEDKETAAMMNQLFVNIKVDKEERPDLDKVYQTAHYYLSQQSGGWPLTIFLTPDLTPFFSGTYFPREERYQLPSFKKVLQIIAKIYKNQQIDIQKQGTELRRILQQQNTTITYALNPQPLELALQNLEQNYDPQFGGFGDAPKFPQPTRLEYLLKNKPNLTLATLRHMAKGGIYDQLGGGFYRYSVDKKWNIPHFEKMLYDNGQLLSLYTLAAQFYEESDFAPYIKATADWVINLMQDSQGGYYSSLDADSEGEEGKYYRWEKTRIYPLLTPEEYEVVSLFFGLDKAPNFEGYWHFYQAQSLEAVSKALNKSLTDVNHLLHSAQKKLLEARNKRVSPFRDEKILTSWNALMIKGMLLAGDYLKEDKYLKSADRALHFIQTTLWNGQYLCASYKNGEAYLSGYLDDYVFLLDALLTTLEIKWNSTYLSFAIELANSILTNFPDEIGGFFFTAENHEKLLYRPKPMMDDAIPSGNGILTHAFLVLGYLVDDTRYINAVEKTLKAAWTLLTRYPSEHCALLLGLQEFLEPPEMIVIRGEEADIKAWQKLAKTVNNYTFAIPTKETLPKSLAAKKTEGKCCAYICHAMQCREVITDITRFKNYLSSRTS